MKRILMITAALGAALLASGPAAAFEHGSQHCCNWDYYGDYGYSCGCYVYEPALAATVAARLVPPAVTPLSPLIAPALAMPPMTGSYCATGGATCPLSQPSRIGDECLCSAYGGYAQGFVQ